MIAKLLRRASSRPRSSVPPGERVYAIGDVHGRLDLLDDVLARIDADDRVRAPAATTIILLGDLVDRGPDSAGVIERLRAGVLPGKTVRYLLGNHEEVFLSALSADAVALKLFCRIGGRETALSYGLTDAEYDRADFADLATLLDQHVPAEHRAFLGTFEEMIVIGDYAFVHAGVDPRQPLDAQRNADLRWIRNRFLDHDAPLAKMIVHGHTVSETVERKPHRIGIDTGAYLNGRLTALALEGDASWELQT